MHGNKKKETDTETEKWIYYDFRKFHDFSKKITLSLTVNKILESLPSNYFKGLNVTMV